MKIVVFDLESKLSPGTDCKWEEKDKMGISVGVSFSYVTGEQQVWLDDNMKGLWKLLLDADLVTGFNILSFDIPLIFAEMRNLLQAEGGPIVENWGLLEQDRLKIVAKSYDVFPVSKAGTKLDKYAKGFKVDDHLKAMYGEKWMKTGQGAMAPQLYKDGKMGELISYCMGDVHRERLLFEQCWYAGQLRSMGFKNGTEPYDIEQPQKKLGVPDNWRLPFSMFPTSDKGLITIAEKFIEPVEAA